MNIMDVVKEKLKSDFQMSGLTAKSLAETGDLLLLLDEKPSDLAKILLQSASRRLHEQIVMLQVKLVSASNEQFDVFVESFTF